MTDIVILTDQKNIHQFDEDGSEQSGFIEDTILKEAIEAEGLSSLRLTWDHPDFNWSKARAIIFRSTGLFLQISRIFNMA